MPPAPLLALRAASVTFGGRPTFADISVALGKGDRACLVGRNGGGKSTLLKALAGLIDIDSGARFQQPGSRVAYMPQEPVFDPTLTAAAFVAQALPATSGDETSHLVEAMLDAVGVKPARQLTNLSGGEGRRVSLARALVGAPDILLLDEPTNHLDLPAIEWLEEHLAAYGGGMLMISHDRAFLTRLSRRTLWLDRGRLREHDEGYASFDAWSEEIIAAEAAEQARADKRIASETLWLREGISARRRRNQGRVRRLAEMRGERARRVAVRQAKLGSAAAEAGGRLVVELAHVAKSFPAAGGGDDGGTDGGEIVVARDFSTRVLRGDRVGLIGRNGAGKSTLLGIMTGAIPPDSGSVRQGANLKPAIFDQRRIALDPDASPWTTLAGDGDTVFVQERPRHVASYLKDFLFEDRQFKAKVSTLSGGERNRLLLAKVLAQPSNLLILDEPTNDLDIETLDLLEELLADYDGTLLLVSHDRDFLDRLVTGVIVVEGNGVIDEYVGGYSDYLRQRRPPPGVRPGAAKPAIKAAAKPGARAAGSSPERMSFKERRELDSLPGTIAALEAEKATLEASLADPAFYPRDRAGFEAASQRHREVIAALEGAEERWLSLAERAETLARGAS
ncbi:MAG TPA: ATP-binding cassette domain-containing protein [Stellaceae bacterium]|nr:ATP-binding cassette domain-containing protein [Stellaceae bacterium]